MDTVISFDLERIFLGDQPLFFLGELVLRSLVIYLLAIVILRIGGKRSRKQLTILELLLLIALGSVIGDVMFYPSIAVIYTIVVMISILLIQLALEKLKIKFNSLDKFINSTPTLIIKDGNFIEANLKKENLTKAEIFSALRLEGIRNMGELEYVYLEIPGSFSIFKFEKGKEREGYQLVPYTADE